MTREIFVYGSNLRGDHGAGSARAALEHFGAVYGVGVGLMGDSYGIPTKDENIETMSIASIAPYVEDFIAFAKDRPTWRFNIVAIGCGLAGYRPSDIAPMFKDSPSNCILPEEFKNYEC